VEADSARVAVNRKKKPIDFYLTTIKFYIGAHISREIAGEGIIYGYLKAKRATYVNYQPSCSRTTRSAAFNDEVGIKSILVLLKIIFFETCQLRSREYSSFT